MKFLLFPTQLFPKLPKGNYDIYLVEDPIYFTRFKFHKLKLAYQRACMKKYADKHNLRYVDCADVPEFYSTLRNITIIDPVDHLLVDKLLSLGIDLEIMETPQFLTNSIELDDLRDKCFDGTRYDQTKFYKAQRKKLDILMDGDKPRGGKWTYDFENRKRLPADTTLPKLPLSIINNKYTREAITYVENNWSDNYGSLDNWIYPIDRTHSLKWLNEFIKQRLGCFGPYQDYVSPRYPFMCHSVISPMLNVGLLLDSDVLDAIKKVDADVPIASLEGFIRQVIGWRNFIRLVYVYERDMRDSNMLGHRRPAGEQWWVGIGVAPIDYILDNIRKYAYAHHIERLMFLGNFMLLCQLDPNEVYRMFMEWTVDSYDWVMVPNIYGMSQFAAGPVMTGRPYFSSSNYVSKMSDFSRRSEWVLVWDALYYKFIDDNAKMLSVNYATASAVARWKKMSSGRKKELLMQADEFLKKLDGIKPS